MRAGGQLARRVRVLCAGERVAGVSSSPALFAEALGAGDKKIRQSHRVLEASKQLVKTPRLC